MRWLAIVGLLATVTSAAAESVTPRACRRVHFDRLPYEQVRLVGYVTRGIDRIALVVVKRRTEIVRRGECVGRERVPFDGKSFERERLGPPPSRNVIVVR